MEQVSSLIVKVLLNVQIDDIWLQFPKGTWSIPGFVSKVRGALSGLILSCRAPSYAALLTISPSFGREIGDTERWFGQYSVESLIANSNLVAEATILFSPNSPDPTSKAIAKNARVVLAGRYRIDKTIITSGKAPDSIEFAVDYHPWGGSNTYAKRAYKPNARVVVFATKIGSRWQVWVVVPSADVEVKELIAISEFIKSAPAENSFGFFPVTVDGQEFRFGQGPYGDLSKAIPDKISFEAQPLYASVILRQVFRREGFGELKIMLLEKALSQKNDNLRRKASSEANMTIARGKNPVEIEKRLTKLILSNLAEARDQDEFLDRLHTIHGSSWSKLKRNPVYVKQLAEELRKRGEFHYVSELSKNAFKMMKAEIEAEAQKLHKESK